MTIDTACLPAIDVMIPVAAKDLPGLDACIAGLRAHCRNPIRSVNVVGSARLLAQVRTEHAVQWIDEEAVSPTPASIAVTLRTAGGNHHNSSWYFQQLIKLNCFHILPRTGRHILVLDADYAFVDDVVFVENDGRSCLALGYPLQWRLDTRRHAIPDRHSAITAATRLLAEWRPVDPYSGMQHHMVFDRQILTDLMRRVEDQHQRPFWEAFLATIEHTKWTGASEYVLYRHFAAKFFADQIRSRHLDAIDIIQPAENALWTLTDAVAGPRRVGAKAIGCHSFLNYHNRIATMDYIPDQLRSRLQTTSGALMLDLNEGALHIAPATPPLDRAEHPGQTPAHG
ncbi:DUF6492 family protein [Nocardia brevicatena]|uniref:DUF6492 family protein n=1 Tax=Nocardia brevicatena TaxID=37327 RepID=UPI0002FC025F|nr:DUF6492 family protein [Nocardia brevicatena]